MMIVLFRIVFFFSMGALSLSLYQATKMAKAMTAKISVRDVHISYVGFSSPNEQAAADDIR